MLQKGFPLGDPLGDPLGEKVDSFFLFLHPGDRVVWVATLATTVAVIPKESVDPTTGLIATKSPILCSGVQHMDN